MTPVKDAHRTLWSTDFEDGTRGTLQPERRERLTLEAAARHRSEADAREHCAAGVPASVGLAPPRGQAPPPIPAREQVFSRTGERTLVRPSTRQKRPPRLARDVGLALLLPFCGAMLALGIFAHLLQQTASVPAHVHIAGYARKQIIRPVLAVDAAAQRLSGGDYSAPLDGSRAGELGDLARSFNAMAAQLQGLVAALDLRRRHAETLADGLPLGTALLDGRLRVHSANRASQQLIGRSANDLTGQAFDDVLSHPALRDRLSAAAAGGPDLHGIEFDLPAPGGALPVRVTSSAARLAVADQTDEEDGLLLVVENLSEAASLRAQTRATEQSFRALIEGLPDALAVHRDGCIVYLNPALVATLGAGEAARLLGTPILDVFHPDDRTDALSLVQGGDTGGAGTDPAELRLRRADGSSFMGEIVCMRLVFEGEAAAVMVARDVTARREMTARMMEMDRMITAGAVAASVGHEINNPLTYVRANIDFGLRSLEDLTASPCGEGACAIEMSGTFIELREALADAKSGSERVRLIVRDLKDLSRAEQDHLAPTPLDRVIDSAIGMASNEIRHPSSSSWPCWSADHPPTPGDRSRAPSPGTTTDRTPEITGPTGSQNPIPSSRCTPPSV